MILVLAALSVMLAGAAYFLHYQGQHADERERAAAYSAEHEAEQIQAECVQVARTRTFTCVADAPNSGGEERRADADLQAQQEMAEWAFAMFIASGAGVLITFAGVIYVALTLHETRLMTAQATKATQASEAAANAAVAANDSFKEAAERQLRPYVFPESITLRNNTGDAPKIKVVLKNTGQTPAFRTTTYSRVYLGPTDSFKFSKNDLDKKILGDIGPGQSATLQADAPKLADVRQLLGSKEWCLRIYGYVTIWDTFEKSHDVEFSSYALVQSADGKIDDGPMAMDDEHNGETSLGQSWTFVGGRNPGDSKYSW